MSGFIIYNQLKYFKILSPDFNLTASGYFYIIAQYLFNIIKK